MAIAKQIVSIFCQSPGLGVVTAIVLRPTLPVYSILMRMPCSWFTIAFLFVPAMPAFPKCATGIYTIRGTIQECCSNKPVNNAKVFVFINNESAQMLPWPEHVRILP